MTPAEVKHLQGLAQQERWSDLLHAVDHHLQVDPAAHSSEWAGALFTYRGTAFLSLDRHAEACSAFSRVIESGADSASPWYCRAVCFLALANRVTGPEQVLLLRRCLLDLD